MSKKRLTKDQKRQKIIQRRKRRKARWEEKCLDKLIDGAVGILEEKDKEAEDEPRE